ncbi:MAG: hypothetical protein GX488_00085 [Clostridiales bacterium]|nr:hypothetical protein [Clostridiales bacterium]
MKQQKRLPKKMPNKSTKNDKIEFAGGDRCVYCGNSVNGNDTVIAKARVKTRSFPVCGLSCKEAAESYVENDKRLKKYMYLLILASAACILISSLSAGMSFLMNIGVVIAGAAFVFLPYPISMFETFQHTPIRRVVAVCRVIGVILISVGVIFMLYI